MPRNAGQHLHPLPALLHASCLPQDVGVIAAGAGYSQRIAEQADWLGSAKIALQGTRACLGWDRAAMGGVHACTAVVDLWLQLLQHSMHTVQVGSAVGTAAA